MHYARRLTVGLAAVAMIGTGLVAAAVPVGAQVAADGLIVYETYASGSSDIWIMNSDGTGQVNLTPDTPDSQEYDPELSPDNTKITFISNRLTDTNQDVNFEVFTMNVDGSGVAQVTVTDNSQPGSFIQSYDPTWSPDATQLAFSGYRSSFGQSEIYKINADGTGETVLSDVADFANGWEPDWSPDGTKILFTWGWDQHAEDLRTVDPDGTNEVTLTDPASNAERNPQWSPDGTRIVFRNDLFNNSDIYVLEYPSLVQTRVTDDPAIDEDPTWSPDGLTIAFSSSRGGAFDIYVIDAPPPPATNLATAGDGAVALNTASGDQHQPFWGGGQGVQTATLTVSRVGHGSVSSKPAGIRCGTDCSQSFALRSTVTLRATAASGSSFAGWGGACRGTAATCTVKMSDARNVRATFAPAG